MSRYWIDQSQNIIDPKFGKAISIKTEIIKIRSLVLEISLDKKLITFAYVYVTHTQTSILKRLYVILVKSQIFISGVITMTSFFSHLLARLPFERAQSPGLGLAHLVWNSTLCIEGGKRTIFVANWRSARDADDIFWTPSLQECHFSARVSERKTNLFSPRVESPVLRPLKRHKKWHFESRCGEKRDFCGESIKKNVVCINTGGTTWLGKIAFFPPLIHNVLFFSCIWEPGNWKYSPYNEMSLRL